MLYIMYNMRLGAALSTRWTRLTGPCWSRIAAAVSLSSKVSPTTKPRARSVASEPGFHFAARMRESQNGLSRLRSRSLTPCTGGSRGLSVDHLADGLREFSGAEGLLQEVHIFLQPALLDDGVFRIAGHVEDL